MAGDWIPATVDLARKRRVLQIARLTGRSRHEVVGMLIEFWGWVSDETPDGFLSGFCPVDFRHISAEHDEKFFDAMIQVGWLIQETNGFRVRNAEDWLTRGAKARLQDNRSKALRRKKPNGSQVDNVRHLSGSQPDKTRTTEQNRTEENRREDLGDKSPSGLRPTAPKTRNGAKTPGASETLATPSATGSSVSSSEKARDTSGAKTRERNELFDAVAEVTASDPATSGPHIGRVCRALRKSDPPYTPAEVRRFVEITPQQLPWHRGRITLGMLEKYIGLVRAPPLPKQQSQSFFARQGERREPNGFQRPRRSAKRFSEAEPNAGDGG